MTDDGENGTTGVTATFREAGPGRVVSQRDRITKDVSAQSRADPGRSVAEEMEVGEGVSCLRVPNASMLVVATWMFLSRCGAMRCCAVVD